MSDALTKKWSALTGLLQQMERVAVAYSGGVDSTFVLAAAVEALGEGALGVIGRSDTYPSREMESALALAETMGARTVVVDTNEMEKEGFFKNPPTRCFTCKSTLFAAVWQVAKEEGIEVVLEGSNADDTGDFRPGMDAARALGVRAPLLELGFTKAEIRELSKQKGLPTWNKPAYACLSSRIPYGQLITKPKLARVERSENALWDMNFPGVRVRDYDDLCRIELQGAEQMERLLSADVRQAVVSALKGAGYKYVCLDLEGYRTGSMNERLGDEEKARARMGKK